MEHILLSGGTGFVGAQLVQHVLEACPACKITLLVRDEKERLAHDRVEYVLWDPQNDRMVSDIPTTVDTVIHLAGANIAAGRWTNKRKRVLTQSRVQSARLLVDWVVLKGRQVRTFITASAIGWYGQGKEGQLFVEGDPAATDFLGQLCLAWEGAAEPLAAQGVRTVQIRTGLVMDPGGAMWKAFKPAFACGIAPRFGSGRQVYSWISLQDLVRLYVFAATRASVRGPVNAVAPYPQTQLDLTKMLLQKQSKRVWVWPVPAWALKLALGELSQELLKHAPVDSTHIQNSGFVFSQPKPEDL